MPKTLEGLEGTDWKRLKGLLQEAESLMTAGKTAIRERRKHQNEMAEDLERISTVIGKRTTVTCDATDLHNAKMHLRSAGVAEVACEQTHVLACLANCKDFAEAKICFDRLETEGEFSGGLWGWKTVVLQHLLTPCINRNRETKYAYEKILEENLALETDLVPGTDSKKILTFPFPYVLMLIIATQKDTETIIRHREAWQSGTGEKGWEWTLQLPNDWETKLLNTAYTLVRNIALEKSA